ncbi:MAG: hypothetical protein ACR2RB_10070 [Gammaproteobacteria bacterium]
MISKSFRSRERVLAVFLGTTLAVANNSAAVANDKCKRELDNSGRTAKYTEQHVMDVGDVPGHQIRILELHATFASDTPNCEGRKRKESWSRGYSDYIDRNGRAWGYDVTTFDNGDKIFSQWSGTSHTTVMADGKKKSTYVGTARYTGGTGIYTGVRGMSWSNISFDPVANVNTSEAREEYWIEK